jgi:hypothetical protein
MASSTPSPKLTKVSSSTAAQIQTLTGRLSALVPTLTTALSPNTVYTPAALAQPLGTNVSGAGNMLLVTAPASGCVNAVGVWTAPDILGTGGAYQVQVECIAGGGGGGGGNTVAGAGGGGGGEYACEPAYTVKPGVSYVWILGGGGTAGAANAQGLPPSGLTGGPTVFDVGGLVVPTGVYANPGLGGDLSSVGQSGAGGSGSANTVHYNGGAGGTNQGPAAADNPEVLALPANSSTYWTVYPSALEGPNAWYILDDNTTGTNQVNDVAEQNQATVTNYSGGFATNQTSANGEINAPGEVPTATLPAESYGSGYYVINPTYANACSRFKLQSLTSASAKLQASFAFSGSAVTVSAWTSCDPSGVFGNNANGAFGTIVANCNYTAAAKGYALYWRNLGSASVPNWTVYFYLSNGTTSYTVPYSVGAATPGAWVQAVGTYSGSTMTLYVNGTSRGTATTSAFSSVPGGAYGTTMGVNPASNGNGFFGYMSNVWVAEGCLNAAGVSTAYGSTTAATGGAGGGASGGAGNTAPVTQSLTNVTNVSTTVTATVAATNVMAVGQTVKIAGITGFTTNNPNGTFTVATVPTATTFTYTVAAAPTGTYASGGTATVPGLGTGGTGGNASGALNGTGGVAPALPTSVSGTNIGGGNGAPGANAGASAVSITAAVGGGGGGAGDSSVTPATGGTVTIPFNTAATYYGTDSQSPGAVYSPSQQGTSSILSTGGQSSDLASGSKNTLMLIPPQMATLLKEVAGSSAEKILQCQLTFTNAYPANPIDTVLEIGYSYDTSLPSAYTASDMVQYVGYLVIPAGATTVTIDLTQSALITGSPFPTALVLGPGATPTFNAFNASAGNVFYNQVYGPGATNSAGVSLAPYFTISYIDSSSAPNQGGEGHCGEIAVTYLTTTGAPVSYTSPYATTDANGNAVGAGLTGQSQAFDPTLTTPGSYAVETWKNLTPPAVSTPSGSSMAGTIRYRMLTEANTMVVNVNVQITAPNTTANSTFACAAIPSTAYWPASTQYFTVITSKQLQSGGFTPYLQVGTNGVLTFSFPYFSATTTCTVAGTFHVPLN